MADATPTLAQINEALRPSLGKFLTPWLLGDWLGSVFTGALLILGYRYFATYPKKRDDRLIYRLVVVTIILANVGQTASDVHALWYLTVNCFGNDLCTRLAPTSEIVSYAFILISNSTCQAYFAVRAIKMYESTILKSLFSFVIGGGILFNLGSGIFSVTKLFQGRNFADPEAVAAVFSSNRMATLGYVGTDACIAVLLVFSLLRTKQGTEFKDTHRIINRLLAYTLGTTAIVACMAALSAGLSFLASAQNQQFIPFFMLVPRLYATSVMFTLLTRKTVSGTSHAPTQGSSYNSAAARYSPQLSRNYRSQFDSSRNDPLAVNVQLETVHAEDKSFDSLDEKYGLPPRGPLAV